MIYQLRNMGLVRFLKGLSKDSKTTVILATLQDYAILCLSTRELDHISQQVTS